MKNGLYRVRVTSSYSDSITEGKVYWVYSDGPFEYVDDDRHRRLSLDSFSSQCEWTRV